MTHVRVTMLSTVAIVTPSGALWLFVATPSTRSRCAVTPTASAAYPLICAASRRPPVARRRDAHQVVTAVLTPSSA